MHVYRFQNLIYVAVALTFFLCIFLFFGKHGLFLYYLLTILCNYTHSEENYETVLEQRISDLSYRLKYAELMNKKRESELKIWNSHLQRFLRAQNSTIPGGAQSLVNELLTNITVKQPESGFFTYLSHLRGHLDALNPDFIISKGRRKVEIVIGVPTIKRDKDNYLVKTLESLINCLNEEDREKVLIVVFIAEPYEPGYVVRQAKELQAEFRKDFDDGLLDVVSPQATYYPDLDSLPPTLGDKPDRVKWRTKQVYDFAYLMIYARTRGTYYLQVEDDVVTKPGYLATILSFANSKTQYWHFLTFSQLGFIGKLFRSTELFPFVDFMFMFAADKPVDWLLHHYLYSKVCNLDKDNKHCLNLMKQIGIQFKPSLFQHIGMHSSLKGKVQKLKDRYFGKNTHNAHINPPADVITSLKEYQKHTIQKAYVGETFFWALNPQPGDTVTINFHPNILIDHIRFVSGNVEHPDDIFGSNTTVEIHVIRPEMPSEYHLLNDGFYIIGNFSAAGVADISLTENNIPVTALRISVQTESKSWVILSEIHIKVRKEEPAHST